MADLMPIFFEAMGSKFRTACRARASGRCCGGQDFPREEFRSIYTSAGLGGLWYENADAAQLVCVLRQ
jgi:hypothetical protein